MFVEYPCLKWTMKALGNDQQQDLKIGHRIAFVQQNLKLRLGIWIHRLLPILLKDALKESIKNVTDPINENTIYTVILNLGALQHCRNRCN